MKKLFFSLLFITQSAFALCGVSDDAYVKINLKTPAKRIISLAPDLTEILFAIGAGKQVIGVIAGTDYPRQVSKLPMIGSYVSLDLEKIYVLHPDLIVSWGGMFPRELDVLKKQGITVYVANPHHLSDVAKSMKNLGCLTGNAKQAQLEADYYLELIRSLKEQYASQKKLTVFYQIDSYALMTINRDSWINDAIATCGGVNVFADAKFIAPEINFESVLARNPEVILTDSKRSDWARRFQKWPQLQAVKKSHLYQIEPDVIERAGPRLYQGVKQICGKLELARAVY